MWILGLMCKPAADYRQQTKCVSTHYQASFMVQRAPCGSCGSIALAGMVIVAILHHTVAFTVLHPPELAGTYDFGHAEWFGCQDCSLVGNATILDPWHLCKPARNRCGEGSAAPTIGAPLGSS